MKRLLIRISFNRWLAILSMAALAIVLLEVPVEPPPGFAQSFFSEPASHPAADIPPAITTFSDATLDAGLNFTHQQGDEALAGVDESLGPGACAFDFDQDGWTDLFLVNGTGQTRFYGKPHWWQAAQGNALFRNAGGLRFEDVTAAAGLAAPLWGMGCLTADFDNDGDPDLLITGKGENRLYANRGGKFTDATPQSGLRSGLWSTAAAAADFNGDGLLDLYVGNFVEFAKGARTFEADSQFSPERAALFDAALYPPQPNQLYLNLGGLRFHDVTQEAGVADAEGRTLDAAWLDLNQDRRPDLLVSNERGTGSNLAYINLDGRHFEPANAALRLRSSQGTRGISAGDLNGDLAPDLVVASAPGENSLAFVQAPPPHPGAPARFADLARENGIGASELLHLSAWSIGVHDLNGDGTNDLFVAAGILDPDPDSPRVPQGQPKQVLLNRGDGHFVDATPHAGAALEDRQSARGAVFADFDNDGDLDVYVAHNNDLGQLLANQSPARHWLGLRLRGKASNRDAIGASVRLTTPSGSQLGQVASGEGFLSDGDKRLLFGLGEASAVTALRVEWPSGRVQDVGPLPIDRYWVLEEGSAAVGEESARPAAPSMPAARIPLAKERPDLQARYLRLMGGLEDMGNGLAEASSHDPAPEVRRAAVEAATARKSPDGLSLLVRSLDDPDPANVLAAIEGLRQYEDEASVRWLLRLFKHGDARVRAASAEVFAFFFEQEEAVVHRKYLAVPYLVQALDDPEPSVRRAAARALASGERYRGVHALLAHLDDPDPAARAEVVRSLGLIRQRYALGPLRRLLADNGQPPAVLANALVALRRLDDPDAATNLHGLALGQGGFGPLDPAQRAAVLSQLLEQGEEATAFDPAELRRLAEQGYAQAARDPAPEPARTERLLAWLAARAHFHDPATLDWLGGLARSGSPPVREAACKALLAPGVPGREAFAKAAWRDPASPARQQAAEILLASRAPLTGEDYRALLGDPQLRALALAAWSSGGLPEQADPWPPLLAASALPTVGLAADPPQAICAHPDPGIRAFCPVALFQKATPERCALAARLLTDRQAPADFRQALLERYGPGFDPEAINTLFALAKDRKDPLRPGAVHKLLGMDSPALAEFAQRLAGATAEAPELRFDAMAYLAKHGQPRAFQTP